MRECVFCNIVAGRLHSEKIYEDECVLAFLDVNPLVDGHTLVIPKQHFRDVYDLPNSTLCSVIRSVKKVSLMMKKGLGAGGVNLWNASGEQAEQSVFHFHIHVLPRRRGDDLRLNEWWLPRIKRVDARKLRSTGYELRAADPAQRRSAAENVLED